MKYIYTAVLTEEENKVMASVPDLPGCVTSGKTIIDALEMIRDAAASWLVTAEDENLKICAPTSQNKIPRRKNDILSVIAIDTIEYRAKTETRAVRKMFPSPHGWQTLLKKGE